MPSLELLDQILLGYAPMIDRNYSVMATRLTVAAAAPAPQIDAQALLEEIGAIWPPGGAMVSLNVRSQALLEGLMHSAAHYNLMIEVPWELAVEPSGANAVQALYAAGAILLLRGKPGGALPKELLPCFKYAIVPYEEDRRRVSQAGVPEGVVRSIGLIQSGVRSMEQMSASFDRGAVAVLGWPLDEGDNVPNPSVATGGRANAQGGPTGARPDLQVIMDLIRQVDAEAQVDKIEATLRRDPTIAFKMMRFMNSPAFGVKVQISSFRQAIVMLGYKRLKRWLSLLLASAGKDASSRPVMFAAVRRGMLMEQLGAQAGMPEDKAAEMFVCGVFSLLDKMLGQSMTALLQSVPVPPDVRRALLSRDGPYWTSLQLARSVEAMQGVSEAVYALGMPQAQVNRAILAALSNAAKFE